METIPSGVVPRPRAVSLLWNLAHCLLTNRPMFGHFWSPESHLTILLILILRWFSTPSLIAPGSPSSGRVYGTEPDVSAQTLTWARYNQARKLSCQQKGGEQGPSQSQHKYTPALPRPPWKQSCSLLFNQFPLLVLTNIKHIPQNCFFWLVQDITYGSPIMEQSDEKVMIWGAFLQKPPSAGMGCVA